MGVHAASANRAQGRTRQADQRDEAALGHADEGTTVRHYVKRTYVAPDLRVVINQLVQQASVDSPQGKTE
ncbi:hypothetical protein [Cellulosimicrobium cellulans]|uniref:hypothetical protein n=1 Tax=Cellulosimicrobium cellulans TaxID=1710 RepID=UPI0024057CCD|nr:hypothetical protein [Cellulosimicrobium cellulans]MDF9876903.1 hypothetical protein [Cellulosimicrobium cellulans]